MRSQLTRHVFRRLISGKGLVFHCTSCTSPLLRSRNHDISLIAIRKSSYRSIFRLSKIVAREPRDPSITPGLPKMIELSLMNKIGARPPPASELIKSWHDFFNYKCKNKEIVNRLQAELAWRTFQHLKELNTGADSQKLCFEEICLAIEALRRLPNDETDYHKSLSKALYSEIQKQERTLFEIYNCLQYILETLTLSGDTAEALELLKTKIPVFKMAIRDQRSHFDSSQIDKLWLLILRGFALEKNEIELLRVFDIAKENGMLFDPVVHRVMTTFFADKNDAENTKIWFKKPIIYKEKSDSNPSPQTLSSILDFCLRNNELEWCKSVFKEALSINPSKHIWDVVFKWAAGAMGKGVEDVERMIEIMIRRNPDNEAMRPDIDTINGLVKLAMSKNDSYLAERYVSLGLKYGINPNSQTLILQLEYRTNANDLRGARAAYDALQVLEVANNEDLPSINKYIRAICMKSEVDFFLIKSLMTDIDERGKRLEALTVAALSSVYLGYYEIDALVDILQTNIYHYTFSERGHIRDAFVQFICNRFNSTVKAWDAYNILRKFFNETPTELRTQIMNSFFERRRCDMACHTFGHMRQNNIPDRKPVLKTYVACLEGIARLADREYLNIVHNMLKLDYNIEPNTMLYNALMLAYTSVCEGGRALSFWEDITSSYEGPDYKSLEIVFWACQEYNNGSEVSQKIFGNLKRMGIDITGPVFAEYMGSLAKDGCWGEVKSLVKGMKQEFGLEPDVRTLGTIYNCLPGNETQSAMETWSKENYPEVWAELRKLGRKMVKHKIYPEIRMRQFRLKRDFKASSE